MTKRRWLKSALDTADTMDTPLPWARGTRRARWKSAARSRAVAA